MQQEASADVPTSWRHPDDGTSVRHGNRSKIIVGIVIGLLAILLIVALILLAIALAKYSSMTCLETQSYYIVFSDTANNYTDQLKPGNENTDQYIKLKKNYEDQLKLDANKNYLVYKANVDGFTQTTPPTVRVAMYQYVGDAVNAYPPGLSIYATLTLEAASGALPKSDDVQKNLQDKGLSTWTFKTPSTNPLQYCNFHEGSTTAVPPGSTTSGATGSGGSTQSISTVTGTGMTCPPPVTCSSQCPTPPPTPSRPTVPPPTTGPPINITGVCVDIVFILDESENLLEEPFKEAFDQLKEFMINMTKRFPISQSQTRIGVVGFGTTADRQINLNQYQDKDELENLINGLVLISKNPERGSRNTTDGFLKAQDMFRDYRRTPKVPLYGIFVPIYAADKSEHDTIWAAGQLYQEFAPNPGKFYIAPIIDFAYDIIFQAEIAGIQNVFNGRQETINVTNYYYFLNETGDRIIEDVVSQAEANSTCDQVQCVADIVLLVDESTTITNLTFETYVIPFLKNVTRNLAIAPTQWHLAMVKICSPQDTAIAFDFTFPQNIPNIVEQLDQEVYCTGTTALAHALNITYHQVFTAGHGARPYVENNMSRIAITITDGIATDGDDATITALVNSLRKDLSVDMYAVGVGPKLTHEYLLLLTDGVPQNIYKVTDYSALDQALDYVVNNVSCGGTPPPPIIPCNYSVDIAFVVEDTDWCPFYDRCEGDIKGFLKQIAERFVVGTDDSRIAMQTYNDYNNPIFYFNDHRDNAAVDYAINNATFTHRTSYSLIGNALEYTLNNMLSTAHHDTSCIPDVIILLSFSSATDPDKDKARFIAKKLQYYGVYIVVVRVGPDHSHDDNFLRSFANQFYAVDGFPLLTLPLAEQVVDVSCNFWPDRLYPCEMDTVAADVVFVVDTSTSLNEGDVIGVTGFIDNFLYPYKRPNSEVRAALVTYDIKAAIGINLTNDTNYNQFIDQAKTILNKPKNYPIRHIANGLKLAYDEILTQSAIDRPNAVRLVLVFAAGCFSGSDPQDISYDIRLLHNTSIYVTTLDPNPQFAFYKELLDVAGDGQHIFPVWGYQETILPYFLPEIAWQLLCGDRCYIQPVTTPTQPTTSTPSPPTPPSTTTTSTTTTTPTTTSTTTTPTTTSTTTTPTTTSTTTTPTTTSTTTTPTTTSTTTTPTTTSTTTTPTTTSTTTTPTTTSTTTTPTTTSTTTTPTTTSTTTTSTSTSTSTSTTTTMTTTTSGPPICQRCIADVTFLIDESSSITPDNFERYVKPFMANLSRGLQISYERTHLAVIQFSDIETTAVELYMNTTYDVDEIAQKILALPFNAGNTALYTALNLAYTRAFSPTFGARGPNWAENVAAYAIIITDGIATDKPNDMAYKMLESGIAIFAIGVGSLATPEYLEQITYDPNRIYNISEFSQLDHELLARILNDTCCPLNFTIPTPKPPPAYCDTIDLTFVLDESESVNQQDPFNFDRVKAFMNYLLEIFTIGQQNTRVAVIGYGRHAETQISFTDNNNLQEKIHDLRYLMGARNVSGGLREAYREYQQYGRNRPGIGKYLVHIVEYAHDVDVYPDAAARALGQDSVVIFNVPVESFQWDAIFTTEAADVTKGGAQGSMQFNTFNYTKLWDNGVRDEFEKVIHRDYRCTTTPIPVTEQMHLNKDEE